MTGRLISLGSILVDVVVALPHLPDRGGDVLAAPPSTTAGGGFNVLAAAARQGLDCDWVGRHGSGPYGVLVREALQSIGVRVVLPPAEPADGDTGVCFVLLEPDGERTFVTSAGVDSRLSVVDLASVQPAEGDWVYVSGYDLAYPVSAPAVTAFVGGLAPGVRVMFDPGPLVADVDPDRLAKVLRRSDIVSLNAREAAALAGRVESDGVAKTLDTIDGLRPLVGPETVLCLRRGAAGCTVQVGSSEAVPIRAPEVRMVDSTGAGDCHTGVLIAGLAQGLPLLRAARRANIAAAIAVTRRGPATGPTPAEIDVMEMPQDRGTLAGP